MNMWNIIAAEQATALTEAIFTLQTLGDGRSTLILDFLLEHDEASLLDLIIATGLDATTLEAQLDLLCQTKVLELCSNIYGSWYQIDYQRLEKVNFIARQLVRRK